jgi:hypothetical protein
VEKNVESRTGFFASAAPTRCQGLVRDRIEAHNHIIYQLFAVYAKDSLEVRAYGSLANVNSGLSTKRIKG